MHSNVDLHRQSGDLIREAKLHWRRRCVHCV